MRILLKISGERLCSPGAFGVEPDQARSLAEQIRAGLAASTGTELAIVIGGGNFLRGATLSASGSKPTIDRVTGDHMGMLATVMNALGLRSALDSIGVDARVLSAIPLHDFAEFFVRGRAIRHLEKGRVVLFAGGTGHPYFTTDTTATLRALQIEADLMGKGTKVAGVFSADPQSHEHAELFESLSYAEMLEKRLEVMDASSIGLCMGQKLPIRVFDMWKSGNVEKLIAGEPVGTLISDTGS